MPTETLKNPSPETPAPAPDWRPARLYLAAVIDSGRRFIRAQICLGWELHNLKQSLGFTHGNNQHSRIVHVERSTWEEWVTAELGIPQNTADRYIRTFHGFQAKLSKKLLCTVSNAIGDTPRKLGTSEAETLLQTLCKPPETFTRKERAAIEKAIDTASDGATQSALLAELKLIKPLHIERGDGTGRHPDDDDPDAEPCEQAKAEQLAFAFFHPAAQVGSLRAAPDFERRLHSLPLVTDDPAKPCLVRMRDDLAALLDEVREAISQKTRHTP